MIKFEWNSIKALTNLKKHGVSFEEAQTVFFDDFAIQFFDDEESSSSEARFLMLGMSSETHLLLVCYCERHGNTIRLISARKATKNERKFYRGDWQ